MKRRDFLKYTVPPAAATAMLGSIPVRAIGMESPLIRALMEIPGIDHQDNDRPSHCLHIDLNRMHSSRYLLHGNVKNQVEDTLRPAQLQLSLH